MDAQGRNWLGVFVVAFLILTSPLPVLSQDTEGVQIVNGRDGVGMAQSIPVGSFQVDGKQLGKDASVKVSKGYFVQFCAQKDGSGTCEGFGEGTHNLASTDFSFVRVGKGTLPVAGPPAASPVSSPPVAAKAAAAVTVFEQKNWLGRSQVFAPGMHRSFRGEFGKINDNQARSVVIAKGFRARFCSEEGLNFRGSGDCEVHEEGRYNLRFANSISFIEVVDLADTAPNDEKMAVVLYEDTLQGGAFQGFDVGTFLASQGHLRRIGDDKAASIAVRDGYRASVCAEEPVAAGGEGTNCEEFGPGRKNLKNRKATSYVRVWKQ